MSSAEVFFQETPPRYRTLAARQNEYLPQVSGRVEGCCVRERAAVSTAAHSVCTCDWHHHTQGRASNLQDQASWCITPLYAYFLPWEQQGIPPTHCCGTPSHYQKGLPKKCRVLAKAVEKRLEALKNLQELNCTNLKLNSKKTWSDCAKTPDPSINSGLYVKNKTIRVLLDFGSSGDLLFMKKGLSRDLNKRYS